MDSLSSDILCHSLDIASITADPDIQPRRHLDQSRVIQYAQMLVSGVDLEPVVTFYDGHDYWLSDGFHRLAAYIHADRTQIPAEDRQGTRRDAILFGIERNSKHGLSLTLAERKNAARRLLMDHEWSLWSDNHIGKICGLNHETVKKIKIEIATHDSEHLDHSMAPEQFPNTAPQLLQSVSWENRKIHNFINDSEDPSDIQNPELLQSVSGGNRKIHNFTNTSNPNSKVRKAMRGGKEYTIDTSNIGLRENKRSESPVSSTGSEPSDLDLGDSLTNFSATVDDTSVLPSLTAQSLRNDPQVIDAAVVALPETPSPWAQTGSPFSLLNIDCDERPTCDHLLEYDLKLVASGPPNAVPLILEQMRRVPQFAELVWQQAQLLAQA